MRRLLAILAPFCLFAVAAQAATPVVATLAVTATPAIVSGSVAYGASVSLSVSLSISSATGVVTYFDGTTILGYAAATSSPRVLTTSQLQVGPHLFSAVFTGSGSFGSAVASPTVPLAVTGTGSAEFLSPTGTAPSVSTPLHLVTGDFDNNGKPDLVTFYGNNSVAVMLGNGDGTFGTPTVLTIPAPGGGLAYPLKGTITTTVNRLKVVDVNQDGNLDIVALQGFSVAPANGGGGPFYGFQIVTFFGTGSGGFGTGQAYFEQDPAITSHVIDGSACTFGSYCQWKDQITDYRLVNGMAGGDFLGTGFFEVGVGVTVKVTSLEEFDYIYGSPPTYGFGPGAGVLSTNYQLWTIDQQQNTYTTDVGGTIAPSSIYLADLQGNGNPDIILAGTLPTNPKNPAFVAAFSNSNGFFTIKTPVITSTNLANTIQSIATADFTGDGIVDVAVGSSAGASVYFATSAGTYSTTSHPITALSGSTVSDLAVGDINADNLPDLVADDGASKIYVLLNNPSSKGTFAATGYSPLSTGASSNPAGIVVVDFNTDGRQDFATANNTANNVTAFLGNIPIITNSPSITASSMNPVVTLTGPYFASNDTVSLTVNGVVQSPPAVSYPNSTTAQVTIPSSAASSASNVISLSIKDTSTGTSSTALTIPVNAAPVLSGLSQSSATINGPSFTLTLTGTSFPSNSQVYALNTGTNVTTQFTVQSSPAPTATSIAVTVPSSYLSSTSTNNIYVLDPGSSVKSNSQPFTVAPGPQISSISPTFVGAGSPTFTLQINGSDFLSGDSVVWTPSSGSPTVLSAPTITIQSGSVILATIDSSTLLQTPGTVTIAVRDSNGVSSNIVNFSVGLPVISAITPTGATTGTSSNVSLTISGSSFVPSSVAQWCNSCNGTPAVLSTQYISSTQLTATVPSSLLGAAGTAQITVMNDAQATSATSQVFTIGSLNLSNVSPASVSAGTSGLTVSLTGANFAPASTVLYTLGATTQTISPTFVSSSQLLVTLPSILLTTAGVANIVVQVGTANSNTASFSILGPTVININPTTSPTGSGSFPIKVTGSNFLAGSVVQWANGTAAAQSLSTSFQDAADLIAIVPANLVSAAGTALVTVMNPGGSISSGIVFTIGPSPTINVDSTGLNPNTLPVGSPVTQITVQGTNYQNGSIVVWNGNGTLTNLATGFVSATQLTATVPAALLATSGVATVAVQNPGAVNSNAVLFTIQPGITPSITPPLSPSSTIAGGPQFQLIVSGSNFVSGSTLEWNSGTSTTALATSLSSGQLSAIVPASLIATAGTSFVSVLNPGKGTSAAVPFTISSNQPTINSPGGLSPSSAIVGSASFQLFVTGTNFVNGSTVQWNAGASAQAIQTVFVSSTSLTAVVPASFLATSVSSLVTVANPGGATSNSAIFSVMPAGLPTINTSGGLAPSTALVGSGQFLISVTGSNFFSGSTVQWTAGGAPTNLATSFISSTQLSALVPASLLTAPGSAFVGVVNPGGQTSNLVTFTVGAAPGPTIDPTSLAPANATAGGIGFQLSMTGTNFAPGSIVQWNGGTSTQALTSAVQSSTQISALVPASLIASAGTAFISVINTGGATSNVVAYTITLAAPPAAPTINTTGGLSPAFAAVGSPSTQLTVSGTGFIPASVVQWNSGSGNTPLSTVYISATQVSAIIPASNLAAAGTAFVTVSNATGSVSNAVSFAIQAPGSPTISSAGGLNPASAVAGSAATQISISGTNFLATSVAQWNTGGGAAPLATTFVSTTQLTAIVPATNLLAAGNAFVSVSNGAGGISNSVVFVIVSPVSPTINTTSGLAPASAIAGSASTSILVNGTNFIATSVVQINLGTGPVSLSTVFLSSTQLSATIPAANLATTATAYITVSNGTGNVSNAVPFGILAQAPPTITTSTGLSPSMANVGSTAIQLTVTGTNFISSSVVQWNGGSGPAALTTVFVSNTTLTAIIPTGNLTAAGTAFVTVTNGPGYVSNAVPFTIVGLGAPTIVSSGLNPATTAAGSPATAITITGTNFISTSVAQFNAGTGAQALATTFISPTQLSAIIPAANLATAGSVFISVLNSIASISNSVTFTIVPPASPVINTTGGLSPATLVTGSPVTQLQVAGSNFTATSVVQWNSGSGPQALATTFVTANLLTAIIPAANLITAGTAFVTVSNGTNNVSNSVTFTITAPAAPTLTILNPTSVPAGVATFQMSVTGTNFNSTSVVQWNAGSGVQNLGTVFVNSTTLTAVVPGALVAIVGSSFVDVANTGGGSSNVLSFSIITATPPTINATGGLSPASAPVGSASLQLSVLGTNFNPVAVVQWNSGSGTQTLATTYISTSQLSAVIPASLLTAPGTGFVTVNNGNNSLSNTVPFSIVAPSAPTILTSGGVAPISVTSGGPSFQITITGANFLTTSVVNWNAGSTTALATSYLSNTQLSAVVPASLITTAGSVFLSVTNPGPLASNTVTFTVNSPSGPTISTANGLIPAGAHATGPGFQLIIVGTNFLSTSVVQWNAGTPTALTTSFVNSTQLTAVVPAALIATAGTAFVSVQNPGPLNSNTIAFIIDASVTLPTLTSLSPPSAPAGGVTFQLTVSGSNFVNGSVVQWNGGGTATPLTTGFNSPSTLSALVPAALIATPGLALVSVLNPDKTLSNTYTFTISGSIPVITQLTPNNAPAGSQGVSLVIAGTGFASGASVLWGTTPLPTILNSSTQLTATVGAAQLASAGSVPVSVQGSGGTSNALSFSVGGPVITLLSPGIVTAGAPAFTLTVGGSNFVNGAIVNFGGTAITTTFVSATQLTASVPANLIASASSVSVTVTNPGGVASAGFGFSIGAVPSIQTIAPTSAAPGSPGFTLQVTGANFANGDTVQWNGVPLVTAYASATSLSAAVTTALLTNSGVVNISVLHNGGVVSNGVQFTISSATLTSISPTTAPAGSATIQLLVNGTSFVNGSGVQWNGTSVPTTFVSATQLSATINATLLTAVGTAFVNVTNPGGSTTTGTTFSIAGPTLTSISPNSATVGAATLTMTLTGNNFVTGSVATWNGTMLPTSVNSITSASAQITPNLLATAGSFVVVITNPGGAVTTSQFFTVNAPPAPTISTVTPTSAIAGGSAFQLSVAGSGFLTGSLIQWNGNALTTSVTATLLTAVVPTNLIATAGTANITIQVPGAPLSANTSFPINPPVITSLTPTTVSAGGPAFQLSVTGGNFMPGSNVQWAGTNLPTIYNSATSLTADVTANLIVSGGTASVTVSNGGTAISAPSTFTIGPFTLVITTTSLPDAVVGASYSQVLTATGGSPTNSGGYTWSVTAGTLPPGIVLDPPTGTLSGTATSAAVGTVGFTVTDSVNRTLTKSIAFRSVASLTISTTTPLAAAPSGVAGFSQILTASGGTTPYVWSLTGTLPPGLILDTNKGVISGTPTVPGSFNFQINVSDSRAQTYSAPFSQIVTASGLTIGGLPTTANSAQQLPVNVTIPSPYLVDLNGTLSIVFTSAVGGSDPAIQFSSGGSKVNFTIPAGTTQAVFGQNVLLLTGTTAGTIVVSSTITANGANVTPSPIPSVTITVAKAAPVITGVTFTTSGTALIVTVSGFSNTRDMASATFQFVAAAGSTLTAAPITVSLAAAFSTYFQSQSNATQGTQFTFPESIPFTGNPIAIGSVSVTLVNSAGTSAAVSANRQ